MEITDCSVVGAYLHIISCLISKGKYFNFEATMINAKKKIKKFKSKLNYIMKSSIFIKVLSGSCQSH